VTLAAGFALEATNCVIDNFGRLGARKGKRLLNSASYANIDFKGGHEFTDIDGTRKNIIWNHTGFYDGGTDMITPSLMTDNGTAFSTGNWDSDTLNDKAYFFQEGSVPKYYDPTTGDIDDIPDTRTESLTFVSLSTVATALSTGTVPPLGAMVNIAGATPTDFNGDFKVMSVTGSTFAFEMSTDPGTDATGTVTATWELAGIAEVSVDGTTATVDHADHGFVTGQQITVEDATDDLINGTFTITVIGKDSYEYTMTGSPEEGEFVKVSWDVAETVTITDPDTRAVFSQPARGALLDGDTVTISGANESEYNTDFIAFVVDSTHFAIELNTSNPATGTLQGS
jgi:hypothetical protein